MEDVQWCVRTCIFFAGNEEPSTFLLMRAPDQIHPDQEEPPGGKVESGESLYAAAIREVWEETGIELQTPFEEFFHCGDLFFANELGKFQEAFFFVKVSFPIDRVIASKEHHLFRSVPYSQFYDAKFHPGVKDFLLKHKETIDQWIHKQFPQESK